MPSASDAGRPRAGEQRRDLSQAPSQPPLRRPAGSQIQRSLGAGPHVRSPSRPGGADTAASPLPLCGRTLRLKARLPTSATTSAARAKRPHSPPPSHPALTCMGLEAASASGCRLQSSAEAPGQAEFRPKGGLCPRPRRPGHRPAPARPSPLYCVHVPTSPLDPPLDPPRHSRGPFWGNRPHSESSVGARTLPRSLVSKRMGAPAGQWQAAVVRPRPLDKAPLVHHACRPTGAPQWWTRTLHNVSQLPVRQPNEEIQMAPHSREHYNYVSCQPRV